jgi:hypothetical protein
LFLRGRCRARRGVRQTGEPAPRRRPTHSPAGASAPHLAKRGVRIAKIAYESPNHPQTALKLAKPGERETRPTPSAATTSADRAETTRPAAVSSSLDSPRPPRHHPVDALSTGAAPRLHLSLQGEVAAPRRLRMKRPHRSLARVRRPHCRTHRAAAGPHSGPLPAYRERESAPSRRDSQRVPSSTRRRPRRRLPASGEDWSPSRDSIPPRPTLTRRAYTPTSPCGERWLERVAHNTYSLVKELGRRTAHARQRASPYRRRARKSATNRAFSPPPSSRLTHACHPLARRSVRRHPSPLPVSRG